MVEPHSSNLEWLQQIFWVSEYLGNVRYLHSWRAASKTKLLKFLWLSMNIKKWATSWRNQQSGICTQRRLRLAWASTQSDQSSLCTQWVAKDPGFLQADSEDSDQTGRMPRLIWVFAGRTCHFVGFVMRWLKYLFFIPATTLPHPS